MNKPIHQNMPDKNLLKEGEKGPSTPSDQPPPPNNPLRPKGVSKTKSKGIPKKGTHHE